MTVTWLQVQLLIIWTSTQRSILSNFFSVSWINPNLFVIFTCKWFKRGQILNIITFNHLKIAANFFFFQHKTVFLAFFKEMKPRSDETPSVIGREFSSFAKTVQDKLQELGRLQLPRPVVAGHADAGFIFWADQDSCADLPTTGRGSLAHLGRRGVGCRWEHPGVGGRERGCRPVVVST